MTISRFNLLRKCLPAGVGKGLLALVIAGASGAMANGQQAYPSPETQAQPALRETQSSNPFTGATGNVQPIGYVANNNLNAEVEQLKQELREQKAQLASLQSAKADDKNKPYRIGSDTKMSGAWKNGGELASANGDFRMKPRGRTQFDWVGFTSGSNSYYNGTVGDGAQNAVDFRRLRTGVEGTLYEQYDFAVELDWVNSVRVDPAGTPANLANPPGTPVVSNANGGANNIVKNNSSNQITLTPAPTDVWFNMRDVPLVGNIRVGNIKYCLGLEHSNSSRFLDFMERSLNQDAFTGVFNNGFAPGVLLFDWNEDQTMTWATSLYKNSQNVFAFDAGSQNNAIANRVTWTPLYDEESHGRYMMHVGVSSQFSGNTNDQMRIRTRGSLRNGISQYWPVTTDTGTFFCDNQYLLIPEWALVWGPWHFQAEYCGSWLQNTRATQGAIGTNQYVDGYYFQAMYFLTGEHREYERKAGAFGRVVPYENFHLIRRDGHRSGSIMTRGAWQIGYRFNELNLQNGARGSVASATNLNGGIQDDHTLGLNHFLNPNSKVQYNFVISNRTTPFTPAGIQSNGITTATGLGTSYGFGIRFALDF
jgi:phosphate-selective porin OprO/OprP